MSTTFDRAAHPGTRRRDLDGARPDAAARVDAEPRRPARALGPRDACDRSCRRSPSAAWTTVMTGCGPARHGVFDHRYYDTAAGQMKVNHSGRVRVPTFWHQISQAGRSVVSLNVPATYPPLDVRGRGRLGHGRPAPRRRALGCARVRRGGSRPRCPTTRLRYFWKRAPAVARRAGRERPADRRELPRPCRGGTARRHGGPRLGRLDGPVPEPRPVPASRLALPERR